MERFVFIMTICSLLVGCSVNRVTKYYDPYGNEIDMPFEELCAKVAAEDYAALSEEDIAGWTDSVLSVSSPMVREDSLLTVDVTYTDWLKIHDPTYVVGQKDITQRYDDVVKAFMDNYKYHCYIIDSLKILYKCK